MPKDKQVAKSLHDENLWDPSGEELKTLPEIYNTVEVSNPCIRCIIMKFGCHNIRPLKYFFGSVGQPANFEQDKPCRVGGCISCAVVSSIYQIGNSESPDTRKEIGRVRANFDNYSLQHLSNWQQRKPRYKERDWSRSCEF